MYHFGHTAKTALIKHKTSSHTVEIPDHGYYRSTYSIAPTTKPTNVKTFGKCSNTPLYYVGHVSINLM